MKRKTIEQELRDMEKSLEWSFCNGGVRTDTEEYIKRLRRMKARRRSILKRTALIFFVISLVLVIFGNEITLEDVMCGIRMAETGGRPPASEKTPGAHKDGRSWWDYGITYVAVQDCVENGYLPEDVVIDLSDRIVANECAYRYMQLLTNRWGSFWEATCHWNKSREKYARKVWSYIHERKK